MLLLSLDDISLDVGKIRIGRKGSAGGHNGLKSIIAHLGSKLLKDKRLVSGKKAKVRIMIW